MSARYVDRESESTVARYAALTVKTSDDSQRIVGSDYSLPTLDVNHLRLHEGRAFKAYKLYPPGSELAAGASFDMALTANAGTSPHLISVISCSQNAIVRWYENATVSGGTIFVPVNRNRESSNASESGVLLAPTVSATGTEFHVEYISAGDDKKAAGSGAWSFEHVLKDDVTYLFRLTNVGSGSATAYISLEWYE